MSLQPAVRDRTLFSNNGDAQHDRPGKRKDKLYPRLVPRMRDGGYLLAFYNKPTGGCPEDILTRIINR